MSADQSPSVERRELLKTASAGIAGTTGLGVLAETGAAERYALTVEGTGASDYYAITCEGLYDCLLFDGNLGAQERYEWPSGGHVRQAYLGDDAIVDVAGNTSDIGMDGSLEIEGNGDYEIRMNSYETYTGTVSGGTDFYNVTGEVDYIEVTNVGDRVNIFHNCPQCTGNCS
jgi:hypothetical protein